MMMTVDACLGFWRKAMIAVLGPERAELAQRRMHAIITKAKQAEDEGRIADMQPLFAIPNMDSAKIDAGWYSIEIRYREVVDGTKGDMKSYVSSVLTPDDLPKKSKQYSILELMSAG